MLTIYCIVPFLSLERTLMIKALLSSIIIVLVAACSSMNKAPETNIIKNQYISVRVENNSMTMVDLCLIRQNNITRLETIPPEQTMVVKVPKSLIGAIGNVNFCLKPLASPEQDLSLMWFAPEVIADENSLVVISIYPSYHDNLQETYIRVMPK